MKKLLLFLTLSLSSTIFCSENHSLPLKTKMTPSLSERRENSAQVNRARFSLIIFALANATPESMSANPAFSQLKAKNISPNHAYSGSQFKKNISPNHAPSQLRTKKGK